MNKIKMMCVLLSFIVMFLPQSLIAETLFSDGFESGDLENVDSNTGAEWTTKNVGSEDSLSVVKGNAHTGDYSLKFHFAGNSNLSDDAFSELRFTLNQGQKDVYVRFYVYFPIDFVHRNATGSDNNKFFDLWGDTYTKNTRLMQTWYNSDIDTVAGFVFAANGGRTLDCVSSVDNVLGDRYYMPKTLLGKWVAFEIHNKIDDGTGNGEMELWVDGVQTISITGMSWVGAPCTPGYFLDGYLLGWANSGFAKDTDIYIDDVAFSDTYIGPLDPDGGGGGGNEDKPPATKLRITND